MTFAVEVSTVEVLEGGSGPFVAEACGAAFRLEGRFQGVGLWSMNTGFTTTMGQIPLTGRVKHKLLMEYRESTGNASVKLSWSSTSLGAKQIVPKAALFYP